MSQSRRPVVKLHTILSKPIWRLRRSFSSAYTAENIGELSHKQVPIETRPQSSR